MRIESRDFRVPEGDYADPVLFPRSDWRDSYQYDDAGKLRGWDRTGKSGVIRFDAEGRVHTATGLVMPYYMVERPAGDVPQMAMKLPPGSDGG